jgi:hypothetical protein
LAGYTRSGSIGIDGRRRVTFLEAFGLAAPVVITALGWLYAQWIIRH